MTTTIGAGLGGRENGTPPPNVPLDDVDLGKRRFWSRDDDLRDGAFATLRREAPIKFFEVPKLPGFETGPGHWALTTFEHVHHASRHPEIFSSVPASTTLAEIDPAVAEFGGSIINLDDPRHQRLRSIVNRAFTPKMVARIEDSVRIRAQRLVADMIANHPDGTADFVEAVSGPLPLQIICDMMGIPEEDEAKVYHWTTVLLGAGDEARVRARRALVRVQGLLGPEAVQVPVLSGGRGPAERISYTALGDEPVPRADPAGPWPGRLPEPAPTVLADDPVQLLDATGDPVRVTGRGLFSAEPAQLTGRYHGELRWWAGPWPVDEWWWDHRREGAGRAARAQVLIENRTAANDSGLGLLLCYRQRQWHVEGVYE